MKKITVKTIYPSSGRTGWRTLEIDDKGTLIQEYTSDEFGNRKSRPGSLERGSRGSDTGYIPPHPRTKGDEPRPLATERPSTAALNIADPEMEDVYPEEAAMRQSLSNKLEQIIGSPLQPDAINSIYRVSVDHYTTAVRFHLAERRKALVPKPKGLDAQGGDAPSKSEIRKVKRDFLDPETPCFFEGCEELREKRAEKINASGGEACPGCVRNSINQDFSDQAVSAYFAQNPIRRDTPESSEPSQSPES